MERKRYTAGFRVKALQLAEEIGFRRAAAILGVTARGLLKWKRKLPLSGEPMSKDMNPEVKAALLEADQAKKELNRLKKENKELKTANLILQEIASDFFKDRSHSDLGRSLNLKNKKQQKK